MALRLLTQDNRKIILDYLDGINVIKRMLKSGWKREKRDGGEHDFRRMVRDSVWLALKTEEVAPTDQARSVKGEGAESPLGPLGRRQPATIQILAQWDPTQISDLQIYVAFTH